MEKNNFFPKFIGSGDAFNVELGNTSAYIIIDKTLILFDCGSTVFSRIIELNLLNNIDHVSILITHTHTDHIGSLATLIYYLNFIKGIRPEIYVPTSDFLDTFNVLYISSVFYTGYIGMNQHFRIYNRGECFITCRFFETDHVSKMTCCGILYNVYENQIYNTLNVYYSGDSKTIPNAVLALLINNKLDRMYQDVCSYNLERSVHMGIKELANTIPDIYKKKIYCMHIDENLDEDTIRLNGFNPVYNV